MTTSNVLVLSSLLSESYSLFETFTLKQDPNPQTQGCKLIALPIGQYMLGRWRGRVDKVDILSIKSIDVSIKRCSMKATLGASTFCRRDTFSVGNFSTTNAC